MRYIIIILLFCKGVFSQTASLDTNSILIGEQVGLTISNEIKNTTKWPFVDSIISNEIEIISISKIDTIGDLLTQKIILTSWDSGSFYIKPIQFSSQSKTPGILINVFTLDINSNDTLKDIKGPLEEPIGWNDIWPWLSVLLLLSVLLYFLKRYLSKNKKEDLPIIKEVTIAADILALKELIKLENAKIWQKGNLKEYHSVLSEIMRRYLENRFKINALELTTDEIIDSLKNNTDNQQLINLKLLLQRADLAKFAKSKPIDTENKESMSLSKQFVNLTKE